MSEETKKKPQHKEEKPIEKMTVKELREIALAIPHEHTEVAVRDMTKEQLASFIKEARGIKDEAQPHHEKKKKKVKVALILTRQDIKAKIRRLKAEKAAAHERSEKKTAAILRRRISRLKKQSRKIA